VYTDGDFTEETRAGVAGADDPVDDIGHCGLSSLQGGIDVLNRTLLPEDVFRVKVSPSNSSVLAVQMSGGMLWMLNSEAQGDVKPLLALQGLDREGFGLEFHSQRQNMLLSASFSGRTCVWDVSGSSAAIWSASIVSAQVEDCCWCSCVPSSHVLATVASDNHLRLYDTRCSGNPVSVLRQPSPFLCCASSPLANLLVTGRQDSIVSVFDPRRLGGGDHLCGSLNFHRTAVYTIAFHPHHRNLFATGDADGQVAVWDLNRSHLMQPHSELKNGHVCLGFVHGGHKERYILCIWLQSHSSLSSIVFDLHFTLTESLTWLGVPILIKTGP
jgi:WD40 repeat protein